MTSLRLLLLRHAKSSWKHRELQDHQRQLNSRGRKAATRIGQLMRQQLIIPDAVYCSTSERTRETAARVFAELSQTPSTEFRDDLYHAEVDQLYSVISTVPDNARNTLIIGHNPGFENFVTELTGQFREIPTGTLISLHPHIDHWYEFRRDVRIELLGLWKPRELAED